MSSLNPLHQILVVPDVPGEPRHIGLGFIYISQYHPALILSGGKPDFGVDKVGSLFTFDIFFLRQRITATKCFELFRRKQIQWLIHAQRPGDVGLERFARFGLVYDNGAQRKHTQAGGWLQLASLVSIYQVAGTVLQFAAHTLRHNILDTVEDCNLDGFIGGIDKPGFFHKTIKIARTPAVPEGKAQVEVFFFEQNFVAVFVFVQIAANTVRPIKALGKRLPQLCFAAFFHAKNRLAPRHFGRLRDLVVCVIGKQRILRIFAAGT
ncbi:MAG: hypothetical protein R3B47_00685 [Bacteroidia bacterium]